MAKPTSAKGTAQRGIPQLRRSPPDAGVYQSKPPRSGESAAGIPMYEHPGLKALRAKQDAPKSRKSG